MKTFHDECFQDSSKDSTFLSRFLPNLHVESLKNDLRIILGSEYHKFISIKARSKN